MLTEPVADVLIAHGLDPARLRGDALLDQDLGLDSLALTEVLLALEDELVICIPDPVQVELRTLGDLVAVVASQLGMREAGHALPDRTGRRGSPAAVA